MARRTESMRTLGKIMGVNLEKRIAECATSMNAKVTANFYDSQSDILTVPKSGEVWELELVNARWYLVRRNDWESGLHRTYDKTRRDGKVNQGDTFLVSDGYLRVSDKFGPLFDEANPGKINPERLGGKIVSTSVVTARVVSFGTDATATIEWPVSSPTHSGTGPAEQGISHVGAIVRAIVDSENTVLWISLPGQPLSEGDSPWYVGSGGKTMEQLQTTLAALNTSLSENRADLDQLEIDLANNTISLDDARLKVEQAREDVDALQNMVADVEETVTINNGKNTYSIFYPETTDGVGKPLNAMWQVMGEDGQTLKETYIWNGTAWMRYGWGLDSFSGDMQQRMAQADADLAEARAQIATIDGELATAEAALAELETGFAGVDAKADQATLDAREAHNAAVEAQSKADAAVVSTQTEYAVGDSDTVAPLTGWDTAQPTRMAGTYIWVRSTVTYGSGTVETSSPALLTGNDGTPAVVLRIDSSRGTAFKNNAVSTVLSVTIFVGDRRITTINDLHDTLGIGAYLEWHWRRLTDESFGLISSADPRLGNAGFTLTVSPDDVDEQTVFQCVLNR